MTRRRHRQDFPMWVDLIPVLLFFGFIGCLIAATL